MGPHLETAPAAARAERGSSFAYSFAFLPKEQRDALRAVYAFCRRTDDIVDGDAERAVKSARLDAWRAQMERSLVPGADGVDPVLREFAAAAARFGIPVLHARELLDGAAMDLTKSRYETFDELRTYCCRVASSVGLMSLPIFGARGADAAKYAVELGIALQLTNIIRDVGADARLGRIYIPLDEIARFGAAEEALLSGRRSPEFASLMRFQAERSRAHFRRAEALLPREDRRALFAAAIMARVYLRLLGRIEASGYDVFGPPARVARHEQLLIAVNCWFQRRVLGA